MIAPEPKAGFHSAPTSRAIARASSTGIEGCMSWPECSLIIAAIVTRLQGTARSYSWSSIVTTVVPSASRAAWVNRCSVRSIMSWTSAKAW